MNRTAYIMALTDSELADEIELFSAEMHEHLRDLSAWSGYDFYRLLVAEAQERSERKEKEALMQQEAA